MAKDEWELENFGNAYRRWLVDRMDAKGYDILFDYLYDVEYRWAPDIPRDSDRESDGRDLRRRFSEETGVQLPFGWKDQPCSFLEFAAALAFAIDDEIMYDPCNPEQVSEWFWMMMENLGLDIYDNHMMLENSAASYEAVDSIVEMEMAREFDYNGYPGMFPLRKPIMDQRSVETWYRANAYMIEEYFE